MPVLAVGQAPALLPLPLQVTHPNAKFRITNHFSASVEGPESERVADGLDRFLARLSGQTNLPFSPELQGKSHLKPANFLISYKQKAALKVGENESYELKVADNQILLSAETDLGILHGLETLLQLAQQDEKGFYLNGVHIKDAPRFPWRGLLIDVARHFIPVPVLKRNIDGMAAAKLNVLHWHLSDDQAFRVESKSLPKLHQLASGGQYYTQEQVREILRYANLRGIRVVPEFDMPAHATAFIVAYPELASNDSVYQLPERWGILNISIDPTKESTYKLLTPFLQEMTALFPDEYFHIGGDENDGRQWKRSPRIQAFMKQKGLKDAHALHTYFNQRLVQILSGLQKKAIGWDEILHPDLPKTTIIQSWRGQKFLVKAAQQGHPVLLSNGYYLDLNYPAADHYLPDPIPANSPLTAEQQKLVLGGEAAMWAEFADSVILDSRIWPRAGAVAERLWSAQEVRNVPDMYRRLEVFSARLETLGLTHNSYQQPLLLQTGQKEHLPALQTLVNVLEPVKEYKRHFQGKKYTTKTPLNRLADAAKPESEEARKFGELVEQFLTEYEQKQVSKTTLNALEKQLMRWQLNHEKLKPAFQESAALREYEPLSEHLFALAVTGMEAAHLLVAGTKPSAAWADMQQQLLKEARKPHGQAELAVVKAIEKLVKAVTQP